VLRIEPIAQAISRRFMDQLAQHPITRPATASKLAPETELTELRALRQAYETELQQRQTIEQQLRQSQQLLQLVMDTLPESIFWKDRDSVYLGCNRQLAEDAGLANPQAIVGKTDYDLPWKTAEADFFRACDRRVILSQQAELGIVEPQLQNNGQQAWLYQIK
jgi:PAS domain-containing protein